MYTVNMHLSSNVISRKLIGIGVKLMNFLPLSSFGILASGIDFSVEICIIFFVGCYLVSIVVRMTDGLMLASEMSPGCLVGPIKPGGGPIWAGSSMWCDGPIKWPTIGGGPNPVLFPPDVLPAKIGGRDCPTGCAFVGTGRL